MDIFEEYFEYLEPKQIVGTVDNKKKLIEDFKNFLDHPEIYGGGFFCIRWKENEESYNNVTLKEFMTHIK